MLTNLFRGRNSPGLTRLTLAQVLYLSNTGNEIELASCYELGGYSSRAAVAVPTKN